MTAQQMNPDDNRRPSKSLGDEMLSLQEACKLLRVPEGTLRYWRHLGAGPRSFKVGRHVRYWRADLLLWLAEQTNRAQDRR
ncbi:helix-turn-helix domain-containing protein [Nocardioides sp.]|uniref:helix-turn-helix transcriptional regulator n=1 Tax=Nocardioides sp. TaxID=35761 RepID=UPI002EDAA2B8